MSEPANGAALTITKKRSKPAVEPAVLRRRIGARRRTTVDRTRCARPKPSRGRRGTANAPMSTRLASSGRSWILLGAQQYR
jgi:hypothetical protein